MTKEVRQLILVESLGYWRQKGMSEDEGTARSVELLMRFAACYASNGKGISGVAAVSGMMEMMHVSPRYWTAILETIKTL